MRYFLSLAVALLGANVAVAFVAPGFPTAKATAATRSRRNLTPDGVEHIMDGISMPLALFWQKVDKETAKEQFYFFAAAGNGAAGIGLGQVPKILEELGRIQALGGVGPTEGGEPLKASPIATIFYPTSLSKKDVEKVIKKVPSPSKISSQGQSTAYAASRGYIVRDDFRSALEAQGCNPLASYAAFDALSGGSAGVVAPPDLEEKIKRYREKGLEVFASDLQAAATTKISAYAFLAFLLFIVFDLIIESGINAFLD